MLAVGALWLACLLFFARIYSPLESLRLYVLPGDFSNQFYPFRVFAANEWRAGRVPLWNPYIFSGHPFLADIQTAVLYPPSFLTSIAGAIFGFPYILLETEMVAHYLLAALFAYLLGRELTSTRLGGLVAGLVFTFAGFLTSYPAQQLAMLESAVWLPIILLLLELAAKRADRRRLWIIAAGLAAGVCLLAGHTQTALYVGYTSGAWYLWRAVRFRRRWTEVAGGLVVYAGVSIGTAAVVILPAAELLQLSVRANLSYEAAAYGFEWRALIGVLLPFWRGEKSLYVGIVPLLLAVVPAVVAWTRNGDGIEQDPSPPAPLPPSGRGVPTGGVRDTQAPTSPPPSAPPPNAGRLPNPASPTFPSPTFGRTAREGGTNATDVAFGALSRSRERDGEARVRDSSGLDRSAARFFGLLGVFGLLLSVGGRGPIFPVLYLIAPGFTLFRDQERSVYLFSLAIAMLAAGGAVQLVAFLARGISLPRWLLALPLAPAVVAAAAVAAIALRPGDDPDPQGTLVRSFVYLTACLAASLAGLVALRLYHRPWLARSLVLALIVADLCSVNLGNNLGPTKPDPTAHYQDIVAQLHPSASEFRVRGESDEVLPPNYAAIWKMPAINGDTPFMLSRVSDFLYAEGAEWRRWQALNVKYFISRQGPFDGVELAFASGDLNVYRVVFSLPRAWAVRSYQVASDSADALRLTLDPASHPGDVVTLEADPGVGPIVAGARPDVHITAYRSQRVELETSGDGASVLVLADTWYPGWRAWIDGQEVPVLRANYVTRAVGLPAGQHQVVFAFVPLAFWAGLAITLATLASVAVYVRRVWWRKGQR